MKESDKELKWSEHTQCLSCGAQTPTKCEEDRAAMVAEGMRLASVNSWLVTHLREMIQIASGALDMQEKFARENSRLRSEASKTSSPSIEVHPFGV